MTTRAAGWLSAIALAAVGIAGIGLLQPRLATNLATAKLRTDVHNLPPPEHLKRLVFGYRSAGVDMLWAKLIVETGLHFQEKRRFDEMPTYLDGIIALEPDFATVYEFVDTLLLFQYVPGSAADARLARRYLEEGTRARPFDPKMWLHYGQYIAFLAPSFLTDKAEIDEWRRDGAFALTHAVDLGADAQRGLAASSILDKAGDRKAAIAAMQREYALTDDPETRRQIRIKLERMSATADADATVGAIESIWRRRYPFLSRGEVLLVGPPRDPAKCAGEMHDPSCADNWGAGAY